MDTEGLVLKAKVHSAKVPEQDGLRLLLESARSGLSRLKHLWLDAGYGGRGRRWAEEVMGLSVEVARKPPKTVPEKVAKVWAEQWAKEGKKPPRHPGQIGRPRIKGERLPNLSAVAQDPKTVWESTKIANWYGSEDRTVEIASATAVWYSTGLPAVPIRWVLIRNPEGGSNLRPSCGPTSTPIRSG